MDKELVAHIVEHVKLANGGDGEFEINNPAAMLRLELRVHEYLMQLGREAVWTLATEVGSGYQGPRVKRGRAVLRFKGNRSKTVHGLYGPVTIRRAYYANGSGETWAPRDEQLGIGGGQTPACVFPSGPIRRPRAVSKEPESLPYDLSAHWSGPDLTAQDRAAGGRSW